MYKKLSLFALPLMMCAGVAQADVIDFEDNSWTSYFQPDPSQIQIIDASDPSAAPAGSGYASLGSHVAINRLETSPVSFVWIGEGDTFTLNSLDVAGGFGSQTITIEGLLNGTTLYTANQYVTQTGTNVAFGWAGIDEIRITLGTDFAGDYSLYEPGIAWGAYWSIDNLSVTAVPEPEAYAMLLAGLALVGAVARRRSARA